MPNKKAKSSAPTKGAANVEWALAYAKLGWHVFPVHAMKAGKCTCGKACTSPGKHPRTANGFKQASADPKTVVKWWRQYPDANVAVATGPSRLAVFDIDTHKDGDATWNALADKLGKKTLLTTRSKTGGGGMHFLYAAPDPNITNSTEILGKGLDTRGDGGYILVPPSNHKSGKTYEWVRSPWDESPSPIPAPLAKELEEARGARGITKGLVPKDIGDSIPKGRRDSTLLSLAGSLRSRSIPQDVIERELLHINETLCKPPAKPAKVLEIARRYKDDSSGSSPKKPKAKAPGGMPEEARQKNRWCPFCQKNTLNEIDIHAWKCETCNKIGAWEYSAFMGKDELVEVRFTESLLDHVRYLLKTKGEKADFGEIAYSKARVPYQLHAALKKRLEETAPKVPPSDEDVAEEIITYDHSREIHYHPATGASIMEFTKQGLREIMVIGPPFRVKNCVICEDEVCFVVETREGEVAGTKKDILARLDATAQARNSRYASDVLAAVLSHAKDGLKGSRAYGIYPTDEGRIELPDAVLPFTDFQKEAYKAIEPWLDYEPEPQDWQAYFDFANRFFPDPHYWMPAYGLGAVAPLTPVLRRRAIIVPGVYHWSRESGSGKSSVADAVSVQLWGQADRAGKMFRRDFAFDSVIDSIAAPVVGGEAESIPWDRVADDIKHSYERYDINERGTGQAGRKSSSKARAVLLMTAQGIADLDKALLVRLFVIHFPEVATRPPQVVKEFTAAVRRLKVLGPRLADAALKLTDGREDRLLQIIEEDILPQIDDAYPKGFPDSRRARCWAVTYFGLRIWEEASGGILKAPPVADFVRDVVAPVEEDTWRVVVRPLEAFQDWFRDYMAMNKQLVAIDDNGTRIPQPKGLGETFIEHLWRRGPGEEPLPGYVVSRALLERHNRDKRHDIASHIRDMKELADLVHKEYGLPLNGGKDDASLLREGQARVYRRGDDTVRGVFVPMFYEDPQEQQGALDAFSGTPPGGSNGDGAAEAAPTLVTVRRMLVDMDRQAGRPEAGVELAQLAQAAWGQGVDGQAFQAAVDGLMRQGDAYSPRHGTIKPNA